MLNLILLLAVLIIVPLVALSIIAALKGRGETAQTDAEALSEEIPPLKACGFLMSKAERTFHDVLLGIVEPQGFRVFAQIPLDKLVEISDGTPTARGWRNRIDRKTVDFVLCEPKQLRVMLAIELDDSSHGTAKAKKRDAFVERVLAKAGVRLHREPFDPRGYKREELAARIAAAIGGRGGDSRPPPTSHAPPSTRGTRPGPVH
jgi:hypothetical protein